MAATKKTPKKNAAKKVAAPAPKKARDQPTTDLRVQVDLTLRFDKPFTVKPITSDGALEMLQLPILEMFAALGAIELLPGNAFRTSPDFRTEAERRKGAKKLETG